MKKRLTLNIILALLLLGETQLIFAQDELQPFDQILSAGETSAFKALRAVIPKPAPEPGTMGSPNVNANSPTLSPIPVPVQPVPPQPRGNPPNPFGAASQRNPWAGSAQTNQWAKPPAPSVGSPIQPPQVVPAAPPSNIYLPPSTTPSH